MLPMTACGTRFILGFAEVHEVINNKQPMLPMTACGTRFILGLPRSTRLLIINNQCYL